MNDSRMYFNLVEACLEIDDPKLRDEVDNLIDSGRVNADDTIFVEKAAPESEWEDICRGSIQSLLASGNPSEAAKAWFAAHSIVG